jgi:hypothetical protein
MRRKSLWVLVFALLWGAGLAAPLWGAYSSHKNDEDVNKFLAAYPFAKGTKLDDCALCHPGGTIKGKTYGSCDYCHQTYGLKEPHGTVPLNKFGDDYKKAGRSQAAFGDIAGHDSDGDTFGNEVEIRSLFLPGEPGDYPGLIPAPALVMNLERIMELPSHSQFLLGNTSKSGDQYARYRGVKVKDLLREVGVRPEAESIDVFAPESISIQLSGRGRAVEFTGFKDDLAKGE